MTPLNEKIKNQMLKNVSQKTGMTEAELKEALESGKLDSFTKGMSQGDIEKLTSALSNPSLAQKNTLDSAGTGDYKEAEILV